MITKDNLKEAEQKMKEINVRKVHQNRRRHRNVDDFFEDMIWNYGYHEVN